jgi:hypothetical protein
MPDRLPLEVDMTTRTARTTLTIKLTAGKDDDLIAWLASFPKGERQANAKRMLREAVQRSQYDEQCLAQIGQDTAWLRAAFSELPKWMEGLLSRIAIVQTPNVAASEAKPTCTGQLSTESVSRREKRIAKARW